MSYTIRDTCRLCDAKLPDERVLDLGETPLANALVAQSTMDLWQHEDYGGDYERTYPLHLKQCSLCGHVQLPIAVEPSLLFPPWYPYASSTGASFRKHLDELARHVAMMRIGLPKQLVVEIGSNDGYLLEQLHGHGFRTLGIDPAAKLASAATREGRLTIPEFFDRKVAHAIQQAAGQADLIVANNVFAHADDLHEIVEGVKVLLAPEGRFVFEVGYLPDVLRTNNFPVVYHEHLSYHHITPLRGFFARHGLRLRKVDPINTQGGSIRCFVDWHIEREPGVIDSGCTIESPEVIRRNLADWHGRAHRAAVAFREPLIALKQKGKTIAGYGASAKSTTLLSVANLGRGTFDFVCDDNPLKVGKFTPGSHIPIVPGSWLEEKQPDYCVSLSGNFSEAFKAEHPEYRGEWIEPNLMGGN